MTKLPPAQAALPVRQQEVLAFIRESVKVRGFSPSLREIGDAIGLSSTASVSYQIKKLQEKGFITTPEPGLPRSYRVVGDSPDQGVPELRHVGCPLLATATDGEESDHQVVLRVVLEPAIAGALRAGAVLTVKQLPVADGDSGTRRGWAALGQVTGVLHPLSIMQAEPVGSSVPSPSGGSVADSAPLRTPGAF
ncbi:LexA family protein [Streptomyces sp. NPDC002324]